MLELFPPKIQTDMTIQSRFNTFEIRCHVATPTSLKGTMLFWTSLLSNLLSVFKIIVIYTNSKFMTMMTIMSFLSWKNGKRRHAALHKILHIHPNFLYVLFRLNFGNVKTQVTNLANLKIILHILFIYFEIVISLWIPHDIFFNMITKQV